MYILKRGRTFGDKAQDGNFITYTRAASVWQTIDELKTIAENNTTIWRASWNTKANTAKEVWHKDKNGKVVHSC